MNARVRVGKGMLAAALAAASGCLTAAGGEIGGVTRGGPDVTGPTIASGAPEMLYGLAFPVQVAPRTAALFCNLRMFGRKSHDYENGADVFVFDDLACVGQAGAAPVTRNETEKDEATGEQRFIVKFPPTPGFWPLGAKKTDGLDHPGAGKGFAFCQALSFVGSGAELDARMYGQKALKRYVEVQALAFDGQRVAVTQRTLLKDGRSWATAEGWNIISPGLQPAIPDGDDLLMAVTAVREGAGGASTGVCRFRFVEGAWRPGTFTPVTGGAEPSLARRRDGALFFTTRASGENSKSIELWTGREAGGPWSQHLRVPNARNTTTVSVHATADGEIFVLANCPAGPDLLRKVPRTLTLRAQLALWQLAEGAAEFRPQQPRVIRDCLEEFGVLEKHRWYADHPVSATVRLADGLWHGLVVYRVMAFPVDSDKDWELLTPQTGCYVEEAGSAQPATPPWRF